MAAMRWRSFGQGLESWAGAREPGEIQSEVNRLFDRRAVTQPPGGSAHRPAAAAADARLSTGE